MPLYRMDVAHRAGSRFSFECEAANVDEAERIGREWHPGSKIGRPHLTNAPHDVLDTGWVERSHRAAAALIAESPLLTITAGDYGDYDKLEGLVAQAWRQGHLDGLERVLSRLEPRS